MTANIPDAAIEAVAEAIYRADLPDEKGIWRPAADVHPADWTHDYRDQARAALTAAYPILRAELAAEIEAHYLGPDYYGRAYDGRESVNADLHRSYDEGLEQAARIVRGDDA